MGKPTVVLDWVGREDVLAALEESPAAVTRALKKAGRDTIRAMRAASNRIIRGKKKIKVRQLNKGLVLEMPRGSKVDDLVWRLKASGRAIPLSAYPHRQTKKGVSVQVNVGSRKLIPGAFIATMRSGHRGVFFREGKARTPIRQGFSTRISDVFNDRGVVAAAQTRGREVFNQAFTRLLPLELEKARSKALDKAIPQFDVSFT